MGKGGIFKIGIGVLAVALLAYFYLTADRTPDYNWKTHYKHDSKDPYGCFLLYELVKESASSKEFTKIDQPIHKVLGEFQGHRANYIFIGSDWYYSYEDILSLADFVYEGNQAYIISESYPYDILSELDVYASIFFGTFSDEEVTLTTDDLSTNVTYYENWEKESRFWTYADSVSQEEIEPLGYINESTLSFVKVQYGEGSLYLHFVPLAFTNVHLRDEEKLRYANSVFSNFTDGDIFWDNFSSIPNDEYSVSESPLSFILGEESLRWAWYILLAAGLVYIVFYTRRKQRVIPVINPVKNTSIDFVKTIGSIYYHEEAALKIINHQKRLLLTYIKTRYGISISDKDESFLQKVSLKSGIKEADIDLIFKEAKRLELRGDINKKDLIAYNKLTENFYRNSK